MSIIDLNGHIYVMKSFLKRYGVKEKTIIAGLSRNRLGKSNHYHHYKHPTKKKEYYINYKTISYSIFKKHSLPPEHELFNLVESEDKKLRDLTRERMQHAYDFDYLKFQKNYLGTMLSRELIKSYARTTAIFHVILDSKQFYKINLKETYLLYQEFHDLQFNTKSLKSFYAKLNEFKEKRHMAFLHGSLGLTKSNYKLTEDHTKEIKRLYIKPAQLSYRQIHKETNLWAIKNGFTQVSISSIKKVLGDPIIQNTCKPFRNGKEWSTIHTVPFKLREAPKNNGDLWQLDGTKLQFPYYDENENKIAYLNIFVVLDVHSKKIVGYSLHKSEEHKMIIRAVKNAIFNTGYIPDEMVIDNAKAFSHEKFKNLEMYLGLFGTYVRRHIVRHPQDKGQVERFFNTFQSTVCKGKFGYIGEGIKTKIENGKPSEEILKLHTNKNNLRTKKELENFASDLIKEYNELQIHPTGLAPNIAFEIAKSPHAIYLSDNDKALMLWEVTNMKVSRSTIILSKGSNRSEQFQYIIYDDEIRNELNGQIIQVRYLEEDRSKIKLFDLNDQFIVELKLEIKKPATRRKRHFKNEMVKPNHKERPIGRINKSKKQISNRNLFQSKATLDEFTLD